MKRIFILLMLMFSVTVTSLKAQDNYDVFLARQFAEQGEYEKAASYYERLTQSERGMYELYDEYLQVLKKLQDYKTADKIIRKAWSFSGKDPYYLIDLMDNFKIQGDEKNALKTRQRILDELRSNIYEIKKVANKLVRNGDISLAKEVYFQGRKLFKDPTAFSLDLASLAGMENDFKGMVDAYLEVIYVQPEEMNTVTAGIQRYMKSSEDTDYLESALYKKIAQQKVNWPYLELLSWLYMQRNDFESALEQARALDMQLNENGSRLMLLARTAAEQKDFPTALKAYQYVLDKGAESYYFVSATLERINTRRDQITFNNGIDKNQLLALRADYQDFRKKHFNTYASTSAAIDWAALEARFLGQTDSAILILQKFTQMPQVPKELVARAKLDLGDYFIIKEEPWEATLLYTQVEKDMKGTPIGEDAKFRNARLAYFKGDFDWAQTQLKIVQTNTSELISNDAIHLKVFITDNMNLDSIQTSLLKYAKAELLLFCNKSEEAEAAYQDILKTQPGHPLEDDIFFQLYKIARNRGQYEVAKNWLEKITNQYYFGILADDAFFYLAELEEKYLQHPEKASEYYEKILTDYPDSTFGVEARKRYRILRGEL